MVNLYEDNGEIKKYEDLFSIKIDIGNRQDLQERISYEIDPKNSLSSIQKSNIVSRLTNPDGIIFSLHDTSMNNLERYIDKISSFQNGTYIVTMTLVYSTTSEKFEQIDQE